MAQNVSLLGADYPAVPKVVLPKTGGGSAIFTDVSDTTAAAADVAKGVVFYTADGTRTVGTLDVGNTRIWYGTCSTAKGTQNKQVTISGLTALQTGDIFVITFTTNQEYNGVPKFKVNSLTAANIRRVTGTDAGRYEWLAGETLVLVWNGTYFLLVDGALATTKYSGITKLATSGTSTSETTALTPAALNNFATVMISGATPYSASETYEVGDRVRYQYQIYECIVPITEPEAWTAAHWSGYVSIMDQIDAMIPEIKGLTVAQLTT